MSDSCPICTDPSSCKGYSHLWQRLREDRARWLPVHERINAAPAPPAAYPPLTTQATSAAKAAIGFLADGLKVVDEGEQARRLILCESCDRFDPGPRRCRECGCYSALKTRIRSQHCPLKKW